MVVVSYTVITFVYGAVDGGVTWGIFVVVVVEVGEVDVFHVVFVVVEVVVIDIVVVVVMTVVVVMVVVAVVVHIVTSFVHGVVVGKAKVEAFESQIGLLIKSVRLMYLYA